MISHVHRCIFIHVPKTGGTSVEAYLREHAAALGHRPEPGLALEMRREGLAHILNQHPDYRVFAFVRNPFDRLVSTWRHGLRGVGPYYDRPVRELSFVEYVRIAAEGRVEEQSRFDRYHLLPQVNFIPGNGRNILFGVPLLPAVTCGFIGRFERLESDFSEVCRRLGIPRHPLPHLQRASQDSGAGQPHWSQGYDAETIRRVCELYRDDLAALGYDVPAIGRQRETAGKS